MNEYHTRGKELVEKLGAELAAFVDSVTIEEDENNKDTFILFLHRNGKKYRAHKDYRGYINIYFPFYGGFYGVSSHKRREIEEKYTVNNMKVPTQRKVSEQLDALDAIEKELSDFQTECLSKKEAFRTSLGDSFVQWNTEKTGGWISKGGLEYNFQMCDDGYIMQKIEVSYKVKHNFETFQKLANNAFDSVDEE